MHNQDNAIGMPFSADNMPSVQELFGVESDLDLADGAEREQAIHPFKSFIVQAPAGSGKTSLLTQRFLGLLSQVQSPEQIIAMTFTKKAAAEMRERIMKALAFGIQPWPENGKLMEQNLWRLARKALQRDQDLGWGLLQNPNRLRIKTIDGFNSFLVGQMPLLSKMGAQLSLSDRPQKIYQEAVRQILQEEDFAPYIAQLLDLVNGRYARAQNLLVAMLQKRDQWMGHVQDTDEHVRQHLEFALQEIVAAELKQLKRQVSKVDDLLAEVCEIADYAQHNDQSQLAAICGRWPFADDDSQAWRVLAEWILTKDGKKLRGRLTKNEGFPTGKGEAKERKEQMVQVLQGIGDADFSGDIVTALAALKDLPDPQYSDQQWQALQSLMILLKICAANLKLVFQQRSEADFIEIAQAASQALGSELEPTDLAQQLDYQIQHLLIDEFQDTSSKQYELVNKLVAGWQPDDGRTLFIVGDPMQSIYRFREAEVANFLKAWQGQFGPVTLHPLNLTVNFRSAKQVVEWVNDTFRKVLPKDDDMAKGAVKFSRALTLLDDTETAVFNHWHFAHPAEPLQVPKVVQFIEQRLAQFAEDKDDGKQIAILGRSRSHLLPIAAALKKRGIAFRAVELETLQERQEVQDMLALSRALLHLGDRAAWIALLRSPLVGLSLHDLHALLASKPYKTASFCISQAFAQGVIDLQALSVEGKQRLQRAWAVLQAAISQLGVLPFSQVIEQTWLLLDGPLTVENRVALDNVRSYLQTLAEFDHQSLDLTQLEEAVETLFAAADSSEQSQQIEIMTMHKSKGLEFDTVVLPGLEKPPRNDDPELLSWFQFMDAQGEEQLVLAPLDQKGAGKAPLTQFLRRFEKQKQTYELGRLLYVACTRAKSQLHLFAELKLKADDDEQSFKPASATMLEAMWPAVQQSAQQAISQQLTKEILDEDAVEVSFPEILVPRLPLEHRGIYAQWPHLQAPQLKVQSLRSLEPKEVVAEPLEDTVQPAYWQGANLVSKAAGNLVHLLLEQWARQGIENIAEDFLSRQQNFLQRWLAQQGLDAEQQARAWEKAQRCLNNAYQDPQLRWALSAKQQQAISEYELQSLDDKGEIALHIIDRTLIDEQGTRWIIDYKTSACSDCDSADKRQAFITEQSEYYRPQLQRYGNLMSAQENRPQKWVLYLAEIDEWVEVENC